MVLALLFLVIGGVLMRFGVTKRGTKAAILINFAGIIALIIFVIFAFKSCQDSTNIIETPTEQEPDTTANE